MKKLDFHVHMLSRITLDETEHYFRDLMDRQNLCGVCIHALTNENGKLYPDCNKDAMEIKRRIPGSYAFASLEFDGDFIEQTKKIVAQGFDGIKLLNGKPSQYRLHGSGYETEKFDRFFAYAEEQQIPILVHNNDPAFCWDPEKTSETFKKLGWFYGGGDVPTHEEFFVMLEQVLERHPNLRLAIAHMGYYYEDIPRAAALLDKYPNLYLDMTPAVDVYENLSLKAAEAEAFIRKYHNRLMYGTDADNNLPEDSKPYKFNNVKNTIIKAFYEGGEPCRIDKYDIVPISLEPYMVENIYYNNAMRFMKKMG